jgi:hypothetical protein
MTVVRWLDDRHALLPGEDGVRGKDDEEDAEEVLLRPAWSMKISPLKITFSDVSWIMSNVTGEGDGTEVSGPLAGLSEVKSRLRGSQRRSRRHSPSLLINRSIDMRWPHLRCVRSDCTAGGAGSQRTRVPWRRYRYACALGVWFWLARLGLIRHNGYDDATLDTFGRLRVQKPTTSVRTVCVRGIGCRKHTTSVWSGESERKDRKPFSLEFHGNSIPKGSCMLWSLSSVPWRAIPTLDHHRRPMAFRSRSLAVPCLLPSTTKDMLLKLNK